MNAVIWLQEPNFQLLTYVLNTLGQLYGNINILGITGSLKPNTALNFNGTLLPGIDKHQLQMLNCDLIVVVGQNTTLKPILAEAKTLGTDTDKIVSDRLIMMPGFSLEKYKRLRRSQLSILAMNDCGKLIGQIFGIETPSIEITASDADFLNFIRDPWRHFQSEFISKVNWFNLLVVMYTENPKILEAFNRLPYAKKICFVPFETSLESGYFIPPYYTGGLPIEQAVNRILASNVTCFDLFNAFIYGMKTPVNIFNKAVGSVIKEGNYKFITSDGKIRYLNWEAIDYSEGKFNRFDKDVMNNGDNLWFTRFVRANVSANKSFNFLSVYGDPRFVRQVKLERKIFYTNENVYHWPWYDGYQDYCLPNVELAMGYEYLNSAKYLRFPWWLQSTFSPELDMPSIKNKIAEINSARNSKKYDCVVIASHDMMNVRMPIFNQLQNELRIKSAGQWNKNTDELQKDYEDNKFRYVHEFQFNICPENCNRRGYVTEKLFGAFQSGSIPIYYGSDNRPEPDIINPDAVLFFDPKSDNEELVREVRRLKSDDAYYDKFIRQEKLFAKPAAEFVYSTFEELAKRLRDMK